MYLGIVLIKDVKVLYREKIKVQKNLKGSVKDGKITQARELFSLIW